MESLRYFKEENRYCFYKLRLTRSFIFAAVLGVACFSLPSITFAASLYFSPSSAQVELGDTFTVIVNVSSVDQATNAVQGTVSFPADKLQVVSLSKAGSIIKLWVTDPSYSNMVGTVQFEGVILNPGFIGTDGGVLRITFSTKSVETAAVKFATGQVLANDGLGTNILSSLGTAAYTIKKSSAALPPAPRSSNTETPEINSITHPREDAWYADANPEFIWTPPLDVNSVRLSYSTNPTDKPETNYPVITRKKLNNVPDGVWYLHVRYRTSSGWGDVAHRRFQIDTVKPAHFNIVTVGTSDNDKTRFNLDAFDKTSGIDHYEIVIDGRETIRVASVPNSTNATYETISIHAGKHALKVSAVDKANNTLAYAYDFTAPDPASPVIRRGFFGLSPELTNLLALLALFVIIVEALIFLGRYFWHKFQRHLKGSHNTHHPKKDGVNADHSDNHSLNLFRNEIETQVFYLEDTAKKRALTREEEKILHRLKKVIGVD